MRIESPLARPLWRALALCVCLAAPRALHAATPPAAPGLPSVKALQKQIGRSPSKAPKPLAGVVTGDSWRVSHVIGEASDGLVVAIGVATDVFSSDEIEAERAQWEGWDGSFAEERHTPLAFLFQRAADGTVTPLRVMALPTAEAPHADFGWGFAKLADVDGDQKPELAVVYAYRTLHPGSTFGEARRKEITWLSVAPTGLKVQATLLTEETLGDLDTPGTRVTYRFVAKAGTAFRDLEVTTDGGQPARWAYDAAKDAWVH